jgi:hypothetical protein
MTTSTIARADALFQEQIHAQWRDWRSYLKASLLLLEAQAAASQPVFERAESHEQQAKQAERDLAAIPQAQRMLFDRVREERRQQLQVAAETNRSSGRRQAVDPDAIDRQALTALLEEAEGHAEGDERQASWGDVPLLVDGAVQWYRVHVPTLLDVPGAAAYAAGGSDGLDLRRRIVLSIALGAGALLFLLVWFLWPHSPARPTSASEPLPVINGTRVPVWTVRSLTLASSDGAQQAIALDKPRLAVPLVICVPAAQLQSAAEARLRGDGDTPERVYTLSPASIDRADLRIEPCEGISTEHPALAGMLQRIEPLPLAEIGVPVALSEDTSITLQAISIVGPGQDGTLPPDSARIIIRIAAPNLDWPTYAPTLLQADGTVVQSPEQVSIEDGIELRYLVPLPAGELELAWQLTLPQSGAVMRWRATLSPPPDRALVLRKALEAQRVELANAEGNSFALQLMLRNSGDGLLTLSRDDLALKRGSEVLPLPDLPELHAPLAPGEARTLTIPLPEIADGAPLVLSVGSYRWQIAP